MKSLLTKKASSIIGLDIGTRYIKAVHIDISNDITKVIGFACEPIIGNAFNEREVKDFDAVSIALKKIKNALKTKVKDTAIAVSGSSVISKVVFMEPEQSDFELEGQIEIEADSLIPYPLEEVYLDFEELGESKSHVGKVEVLLSAAHKDLVDSRITLVREIPFEPKIVDIEGYALANAVQRFTQREADAPLVCISIGATLLQICTILNDKVIYNKEHSFGMDKFIQDLAMIHGIDKQEVESQVVQGTAPDVWMDDNLPIFLSSLQQQIQRALQMYTSTTHQAMPQELYLAGGGAVLSRICVELGNDTGIDIKAFNPFLDMAVDEKINAEALHAAAPQLAIAMGLASRSYDQCHM